MCDMQLNIDSFHSLVQQPCHTAVVYGRYDCRCGELEFCLKELGISVFNYNMGVPHRKHEYFEGQRKRVFYKISYDGKSIIATAKAALVNALIENYRRSKENLPMIPVIFCLEANTLAYGEIGTPEKFDGLSVSLGDRCTDKELRRAYKLVTEFNPDVSKVANETFLFVRIKDEGGGTGCRLEKMEPFWNTTKWKEAWNQRKQAIDPKKEAYLSPIKRVGQMFWPEEQVDPKPKKTIDWRAQFRDQIRKIDEEFNPNLFRFA